MRISDWSSDVCSSYLAGRLGHRQAGADRRGHRLLDEENPAGTGALGRLLDRSALDRGGPGGPADDDLRAREGAPVVHLADEVLDHLQIGRASCWERVCQYV